VSDREALLTGIRAAPGDDLPRLVMADWLDEQGTDRDAATAEFIRLGCKLDAGKGRLTKYEGHFLDANWRRLLPHLAAEGFKVHKRSGRDIVFIKDVVVSMKYTDSLTGAFREDRPVKVRQWCNVTFWRGFAERVWSFQGRDLTPVALAAIDQPLATLALNNAIFHLNAHTSDVSNWSLQHGVSSLCVPPNDVFDRVHGYDVLTDSEPFATNHYRSYKRFNRPNPARRAEASLSAAIREWAEAAHKVPGALGKKVGVA
jgi:uncharacterized protein (TIGR02996 family)